MSILIKLKSIKVWLVLSLCYCIIKTQSAVIITYMYLNSQIVTASKFKTPVVISLWPSLINWQVIPVQND